MKQKSSFSRLQALKSIEKIIQLCGNTIKSQGWELILTNVGQASETTFQKVDEFSSQAFQNGFKCLKLIILNYIQNLGQQNFVSIFNCIQLFAQADTENINQNLTAIGLFMNVADYTAKLTQELQSENRTSDISVTKQGIDVSQIWNEMFAKIKLISLEFKAELRRSIVQIFENIIVIHGGSFSEELW